MPDHHRYGLILAGGRGTRFWPRSRRRHAKQVLDFFGGGSLIRQTVDRLKPLIEPERLWVLTNDYLREEIVRQLPEIPKRQILAEPAQRNTAPAIGLMARILEDADPEAVMGVFPADHIVAKPQRFLRLLRPAFRAAAGGRIVVIGLKPRWAETGYGYVEFPPGVEPGALTPYPVHRFREKPDRETAEAFLEAGNFYWNGGMFFWRAKVVMDALRLHLPATAAVLDGLPAFTSRRFGAALAGAYPHCENISIDYALLEKAERVVGIAADDIGWSDVGSWNAVYELAARDECGNAARTPVITLESAGNYVDAGSGKLVALVGVQDLVIVDTPDALLVVHRSRSQQVGDVVKLVETLRREDLL